MRERERQVGHATENLAADSCKDAIREEINLTLHTDSSQPSSPFDKNENHVTDIAGSIDAAWQCRGSGRSYRSLSGDSSIIGEKSGKVLKFATRKNHADIVTLLIGQDGQHRIMIAEKIGVVLQKAWSQAWPSNF